MTPGSSPNRARDMRRGSGYASAPEHPVSIHIGEIAASRTPAVLHTLLGSCVAVCLYDPVICAGGMNHIWLPNSSRSEVTARSGVHAMELLINRLMGLGGDRRRFTAKAFGGANLFPAMTTSAVGKLNVDFVRGFLTTEKIPLIAERLGGSRALHLYFYTETGKARVRPLKASSREVLNADSRLHPESLPELSYGGDVTLF